MTAADLSLPNVLGDARARAQADALPYAGQVSPTEAWSLVSAGAAVLVDVRSHEERTFVGVVPEAVHVPWATGTALTRNPRFVRELEAKTGKAGTVLLLCRSGNRSAQAAQAATQAGFAAAFNVGHGFEGDLDAQQHRGTLNGWQADGLPWSQG